MEKSTFLFSFVASALFPPELEPSDSFLFSVWLNVDGTSSVSGLALISLHANTKPDLSPHLPSVASAPRASERAREAAGAWRLGVSLPVIREEGVNAGGETRMSSVKPK